MCWLNMSIVVVHNYMYLCFQYNIYTIALIHLVFMVFVVLQNTAIYGTRLTLSRPVGLTSRTYHYEMFPLPKNP